MRAIRPGPGDIDVVIPTWNGRDLLRDCLRHLERQSVPCHVIVVDNGSSDGTAEFIDREFPDVTTVRLAENNGFARAVNAGIRSGEAAAVVLLNNDVNCEPDFLERLVAPITASDEVGMVAALLLTSDGARIDGFGIEFDVTLAAYARFAGAPFPQTRTHADHLAAPSGGAAAYRRTALQAVGLFDEALFAYMEDADLGLRLRAAGWRCASAEDARAIHLGSASFGRRSRFQMRVSGASRALLLRKYGVLRRSPAVAARALVIEAGVVTVDACLSRSLAALRGRVEGWRRAGSTRVAVPAEAINTEIGVRDALRRRFSALR